MSIFNFGKGNRMMNEFELIMEHAEQGDAEAQFQMAKYYDQKEEYTESVKWLKLAVEHNHNDAKWYLALNYYGGCGVEKNYDQAISLAENLLNMDNDMRGASLLGDIYSRRERRPDLAKYYNPEMAEKYYLEIMRSGNKNYWLNKVYDTAMLYGAVYIYNNQLLENTISDPIKAAYCLYLSYLDGLEAAMEDLQSVITNANISISEQQFSQWKSDYIDAHCSI